MYIKLWIMLATESEATIFNVSELSNQYMRLRQANLNNRNKSSCQHQNSFPNVQTGSTPLPWIRESYPTYGRKEGEVKWNVLSIEPVPKSLQLILLTPVTPNMITTDINLYSPWSSTYKPRSINTTTELSLWGPIFVCTSNSQKCSKCPYQSYSD